MPAGRRSRRQLEAHHNQSLERRRLADDFAGLVLYTSGTTGTAQAIGKNLGQLAREVTTLEEQFGGSLERAEIFRSFRISISTGCSFVSCGRSPRGGYFTRAASLTSKISRRCWRREIARWWRARRT